MEKRGGQEGEPDSRGDKRMGKEVLMGHKKMEEARWGTSAPVKVIPTMTPTQQ